ncbi:hypothetical protein Tco_0380997 [Tanacetum coccineum]
MATNEETNAAGTDTRPPMLVEDDYDSWKIRIQRVTFEGKTQMGKAIWKSIQYGPYTSPDGHRSFPPLVFIVPARGKNKKKKKKKLDSEFNDEENKLEMASITQAEIHPSSRSSRYIFNILNRQATAQEIWNNVELLMQGSGRTLQQRKEDLFDEYERFRAIGNESIHDYFVRFHKLVNDMKMYLARNSTHQMNTKFVNNLPPIGVQSILSHSLRAYCSKKTLKKKEASLQVIVDPLAYVAHTTSAPASFITLNSYKFPPPTNKLAPNFLQLNGLMLRCLMVTLLPEQFRERSGYVGNTAVARGSKECDMLQLRRGEGHVA